jgi:hypothetical protein
MKLFEKIKSFFKDDTSLKSEKIIIAQKSCPHCASRGMFVFNDNLNTKTKIGDPNEKQK